MVVRQRQGGVTFTAECGALLEVECPSAVCGVAVERSWAVGAVRPWRTLMAGQSRVSNFSTIPPETTVYPESQRTISMKTPSGL